MLGWRRRVLVTWANTPTLAGENPRVGRIKLLAVRAQGIVLAVLARTRFHAVTTGVARVMRREWLVRQRRVRVAERGRDPARFAPMSSDEIARVREELGLAPGERMVLCVGRQDLQKGHAQLVRAFDAVAATRPDVVLAIAGREGSGTARLEAAVREIRHADRVRLLGHRDDVPRLWQAATLAVCSSIREGAAGALIEAMASGTPIVTTRLDGLEDVLSDGVNAIVVEPPELAAGMAKLLDDPQLAARLAARAREDFAQRFTVERAAEALLDVYRWAAA
jgi:glycosyltransferase involved in cell wall biosynthesis